YEASGRLPGPGRGSPTVDKLRLGQPNAMNGEEEPVKSSFKVARLHRAVLMPVAAAALAAAAGWGGDPPVAAATTTFLSSLGPASQVASTVPGNGDVNPYGVAM